MPIVIEPGLDSATFCVRLRQKIKAMGADKAFGLGDLVVVYSGPADYVADQITTSFIGNWEKSRDQANRMGGRRIDDTITGISLAAHDLRVYFRDFYGKDRKAIQDAETEVWGCASSEFMRAKFRKVASAVCGAAPARVFRKFEIGSLVKNRGVRIINNRPAQMFRDFYRLHPDEAFKLFCITELSESRKRAYAKNSAGAWADYRERRKFFMFAQKYELSNFPALPQDRKDAIKIERGLLLVTYRLKALGGAVAAPGRTTKPYRRRSLKAGHGPV